MALINCPKCNKEISDQSKNCMYCGSSFEGDAGQQLQPELTKEEDRQEKQERYFKELKEQERKIEEATRSSRKKWIIIAIIVAIILGVLIAVFNYKTAHKYDDIAGTYGLHIIDNIDWDEYDNELFFQLSIQDTDSERNVSTYSLIIEGDGSVKFPYDDGVLSVGEGHIVENTNETLLEEGFEYMIEAEEGGNLYLYFQGNIVSLYNEACSNFSDDIEQTLFGFKKEEVLKEQFVNGMDLDAMSEWKSPITDEPVDILVKCTNCEENISYYVYKNKNGDACYLCYDCEKEIPYNIEDIINNPDADSTGTSGVSGTILP